MNHSQHALLSRLVDGDLNPAETAEIQALVALDPDARKVFQDYMATSFAVSSLPRPPIPEDMTERVRPLLAKRQWPFFSDGFGRSIPWWVQASGIFVVTIVSASVYISLNQSRVTVKNQARKIATVAVGDARNDELMKIDSAEVDPESANGKMDVASKVATKELEDRRSLTNKNQAGHIRSEGASEKFVDRIVPQQPIEQFHDGLRKVDRRHAIRIHVPASNLKVEEQVISALSEFHNPNSNILKTTETSVDTETPSLVYLAFVPTSLFDELIMTLETMFPVGLERVSPEEFIKIQDQQMSKVVVIDRSTLSRAKERLADRKDPGRPAKNHLKIGPDREIVKDAIAKPLEELSGNSPIRSLDGVMIVIRSDLSPDEPTKFEPTKTKKRGSLKDPK